MVDGFCWSDVVGTATSVMWKLVLILRYWGFWLRFFECWTETVAFYFYSAFCWQQETKMLHRPDVRSNIYDIHEWFGAVCLTDSAFKQKYHQLSIVILCAISWDPFCFRQPFRFYIRLVTPLGAFHTFYIIYMPSSSAFRFLFSSSVADASLASPCPLLLFPSLLVHSTGHEIFKQRVQASS